MPVTPPTIEQAIEALRNLPTQRQHELAGYIYELASHPEPEDIDPAHLQAVLEGLAQIERGDIATDEEVEAAYRSFG